MAPNTHQIHDFNLDIDPFPSGVFWTKALEADVVEVDLEDREASLRVHGLDVTDYFTLANSFADGGLLGQKPAKVSFDVHWKGGGRSTKIGDGSNFAAEVIEDTATVRLARRGAGIPFPVQDLDDQRRLDRHERNGVFLYD